MKEAAAETNVELGLLAAGRGEAIAAAAREVADGKWDDHFPLDIYQTGSGTSTNMNANEVIAALANRSAAAESRVHPNDHVNYGQSSNDIIPTAIHVACRAAIRDELVPALGRLQEALADRARDFDGIVKSGRTHLMDATPVRLGQEFGGYARQVEKGIERVERAAGELAEVALGGTATGTGINTHPEFASRTMAKVAARYGIDFREAEDHFEAQGAKDACVSLAGALNTVAASLMKVADDIRWLASGPTSRDFGDPAARRAAREFDHAGQGQPGDLRGAHDGVCAGGRKRDDGHDRGPARQLRAERDDAGDRRRAAGVDHAACQRGRGVHRPVHCRHHGPPGARPRVAGAEPLPSPPR